MCMHARKHMYTYVGMCTSVREYIYNLYECICACLCINANKETSIYMYNIERDIQYRTSK